MALTYKKAEQGIEAEGYEEMQLEDLTQCCLDSPSLSMVFENQTAMHYTYICICVKNDEDILIYQSPF